MSRASPHLSTTHLMETRGRSVLPLPVPRPVNLTSLTSAPLAPPSLRLSSQVYAGGRGEKALIKYVRQLTDPEYTEPFSDEPLWGDDNGNVVHVGDEHWDWFRSKNEALLVFFYAPW